MSVLMNRNIEQNISDTIHFIPYFLPTFFLAEKFFDRNPRMNPVPAKVLRLLVDIGLQQMSFSWQYIGKFLRHNAVASGCQKNRVRYATPQ